MAQKIAGIDAQIANLHSMRCYLADKIAWMRAGRQGLPPSVQALDAASPPGHGREPRRARFAIVSPFAAPAAGNGQE
jgi:hypothetical protein